MSERASLEPGPQAPKPAPLPAPPASLAASPAAVLAWQRSAGNQAVARMLATERPTLARYLEKPGFRPKNNPGNRPKKEEWVENGRKPVGNYIVQNKKGQWFRWEGGASAGWKLTVAPEGAEPVETKVKPAETKPEPEPVASTETPAEIVDETEPIETESEVTEEAIAESADAKPEEKAPEKKEPRPPAQLTDVLDLISKDVYTGKDVFTAADARALREVSKLLHPWGSSALRRFLKDAEKHFDPLVSSAATTMLQQYQAAIKERSPDKLFMFVDQIEEAVLKALFGSPLASLAVTVHRAEERGAHGEGEKETYRPGLDYSEQRLPGPYPEPPKLPKGDKHPDDVPVGSKMHLKLGYGEKQVPDAKKGETRPEWAFTGSPNITTPGMNYSTESAVVIRLPGIAQLFQDYMGLVKGGKKVEPEGDKERPGATFGKQLQGFNDENFIGVRAALAPFVNIGETLTTELKGADEVLVRMFLVSNQSIGEKNAPLKALMDLAETSKAKITVVVDEAQATGQDYVNEALLALKAKGVTVQYEKGAKQVPREKRNPWDLESKDSIMHDKIVLAHYPENAKTDRPNAGSEERWTVMLGSSGLTRNVINNWNYENLLMIDDRKLFDAFTKHHLATAPHRKEGIPAYVAPKDQKKVDKADEKERKTAWQAAEQLRLAEERRLAEEAARRRPATTAPRGGYHGGGGGGYRGGGGGGYRGGGGGGYRGGGGGGYKGNKNFG